MASGREKKKGQKRKGNERNPGPRGAGTPPAEKERTGTTGKTWILPVTAGIFVILAAAVLFLVPGKDDAGRETTPAAREQTLAVEEEGSADPGAGSPVPAPAAGGGTTANLNANLNEEGEAPDADREAADGENADREDIDEVVIRAAGLSDTQVSFIRVADDSKVELLARKGADGKAKVALGTCQSCNGAPGAYYTQEDDVLMCNNCGLTFPLSVLDEPGGGCHPIMLSDEAVRWENDDAVVNLTALIGQYEPLFATVEDHEICCE